MTAMEIQAAGGVPATSAAMAASAAWGQTAKLLNPKELQQLWFTLAYPGQPAGLLMARERGLRDRDSRSRTQARRQTNDCSSFQVESMIPMPMN
jgi:hypothetical protein